MIKKLQILHTSDQHGTAKPVKKKVTNADGETVKVDRGGTANVAAKADELRAEHENTLFVDSGDNVSGQVLTDLNGGRSMVEMMNEMDYDAVTLGNHGFDFGGDVLRERINSSKYPIVVSNVKNEDGSQIENTMSSRVVNLNGIKVGMVGLLTDQMNVIANAPMIAGFQFENPIAALARELPKLRAQDVDAVVVLTHQDDADDEKLAKAFPNEGLIIPGGHSHREMEEVQEVDGNYILKSGSHGGTIGQLLVDVDTETNRPVNVALNPIHIFPDDEPEGFEPNAKIAQIVEKYDKVAEEKMGAVLTNFTEPMTLNSSQDSTLGNFVADAMKNAYGTDIAVINSDGIRRDDIPAGDVTIGDLHELCPFLGDEVIPGEMNGKDILEALEHSQNHHRDPEGRSGFLQISGISYGFDENGIKDVKVGKEPLDPKKTYSIATSAYLHHGKLGYDSFKKGDWKSAGMSFRQAFKKHLDEGFDQKQLDPAGTRIKGE